MLEMKFELEGEINYVTNNIIKCVEFYNRSPDLVQKNKDGIYGNEETQKMAKEMQEDDFLLDLLLCDAKTFCNSKNPVITKLGNWECGRLRSHVWIQLNGERVLMIHF
jgi:hypothetical protein